jgi:hypothetical protein
VFDHYLSMTFFFVHFSANVRKKYILKLTTGNGGGVKHGKLISLVLKEIRVVKWSEGNLI